MRITRYLWISNLPSRATEEELINELQSNGKIQNVRIHNGSNSRTAIVAFVDTKSASKTIESGLTLHKVTLNIQYCESSGLTGSTLEMPESRKCDKNGEVLRGVAVTNLPRRSTSTNLREGLFHEFKKYGKITSVIIEGQGSSRSALITFKRSEDADKAYEYSQDKVFFRTPIKVDKAAGADTEDPDLCPPEHVMDEYHPKATKTLFVGNLCSSTISKEELHNTFMKYGEIIEIDIKNQANQLGTSYAFVQYTDIKSVVLALQDQEIIRVNNKPVKLGFGKSQPTSVVWLDNLASGINDAFLKRQFSRYGRLNCVILDEKYYRALLYFENPDVAQRAVNETRNRSLMNRKVQIDYASQECQAAFMRRVAQQNSFGKVSTYEKLQELIGCMRFASSFHSLDEKRRHLDGVLRDDLSSPDGSGYNYRSERKRKLSRERCDLTPISLSEDSVGSDGSYGVTRGSTTHYKHSGDKKKHSRKHGDEFNSEYPYHRKSDTRRHAASPVAYSTRKINHYSTQSNGVSMNLPKSYSTWRTGKRGRSRTRCESSASLSPRPSSDVRVVHTKRSPKHYHLDENSDLDYDDPRFYRSGQSNSRFSKASKYGETSPTSRSLNRSNRNEEVHSRSATPIGSAGGYENPLNSYVGLSRHNRGNLSTSRDHVNRKTEFNTELPKERTRHDRSPVETSPHSRYPAKLRERHCSNSREYDIEFAKSKVGIPSQGVNNNQSSAPNGNAFASNIHAQREEPVPSGKSAAELSKLNRERLALLRELSMLDAENEATSPTPSLNNSNTAPLNKIQQRQNLLHDQLNRNDIFNQNHKQMNPHQTQRQDLPELQISVSRTSREPPQPTANDQILKQNNIVMQQCQQVLPNDQTNPPTASTNVLGGTSSSSEPGDLLFSPINNIVNPPESASSPISSVSSLACPINKAICSNQSQFQNFPSSPLNDLAHDSSTPLQSKLFNQSSMVVSHSNTSSTISSLSSSRDPRLSHHNGSSLLSSPPMSNSMVVGRLSGVNVNPIEERKVSSGFSSSINYPVSSVLSGLNRSSGLLSSALETVEMDNSTQSMLDPVDERIRQLDMELMKSEKVRTVDYSKFRIRRKTDASNVTSVNITTSGTSNITTVVSNSSRDNPISPLSVNMIPKTSPISLTTRVPEGLISPPNNVRTTDTSDFIKSMLSTSKPNSTSVLHPSTSHSGSTYSQWSSFQKTEPLQVTSCQTINKSISPVVASVFEKLDVNTSLTKCLNKSIPDSKCEIKPDPTPTSKIQREELPIKSVKPILKKEPCGNEKSDILKSLKLEEPSVDVTPTSPKKSPKLCTSRPVISSPPHDSTKLEGQQKRPLATIDNNGVSKSKVQKLDLPKATLDDTMFQTTVVKKERKKLKADTVPKVKSNESLPSVKVKKLSESSIPTNLPWEANKKERKVSAPTERLKIGMKMKKISNDTPVLKEPLLSKPKKPEFPPSSCVAKKEKSIQHKKNKEEPKKSLKKKRILKKTITSSEETNSDDSDELAKLRDNDSSGPYESMYDKIKRRTHKDNPVKDDDIPKKGKVVLKNKRRKLSCVSSSNTASSSSGSDTDQCQSDTGISSKSIPPSAKKTQPAAQIKLSASERQKLLQQLSMSTSSSSDDSSCEESPPPLFKHKSKDIKAITKTTDFIKSKKLGKEKCHTLNGQAVKPKKCEPVNKKVSKTLKLKEKFISIQKKTLSTLKKKTSSHEGVPSKKKTMNAPLLFSSSSESDDNGKNNRSKTSMKKVFDYECKPNKVKREIPVLESETRDSSSDSSQPRISRSCTPESDINDPFYMQCGEEVVKTEEKTTVDYESSQIIEENIEPKFESKLEEDMVQVPSAEVVTVPMPVVEVETSMIESEVAASTLTSTSSSVVLPAVITTAVTTFQDTKPTTLTCASTPSFRTAPTYIHSQSPTLLTSVPAGSLATLVQQPNTSQTVLITGPPLPIVSGLVAASPNPQASLITQTLPEDPNKSTQQQQQRIALLMTAPAQPTNGLSTLANAASVVSSSGFVKTPTIVLSTTQMPVVSSPVASANKTETHQPVVSLQQPCTPAVVSVANTTPVLNYTTGKSVPSVIIGSSPLNPSVDLSSAINANIVTTNPTEALTSVSNRVVVSQSPDYTSYVRNVIARVTQEKDVESSTAGRSDKSRRIKKNSPIAPGPTAISVSQAISVPTSGSLLCIAPGTLQSSIPGVNACNKPIILDNRSSSLTISANNRSRKSNDSSVLPITSSSAKMHEPVTCADPYEPNFDEDSNNVSVAAHFPTRSRHLSSTTSEISTGQEETNQLPLRSLENEEVLDNIGDKLVCGNNKSIGPSTPCSSSNSTPQPFSGNGSTCSQRATPEQHLPKPDVVFETSDIKDSKNHVQGLLPQSLPVSSVATTSSNASTAVEMQNTPNLEQFVQFPNPLAYIYTLLAQQQQSIIAPGGSPQLISSGQNISTTNSNDYLASVAAICGMNQSNAPVAVAVPQRPGSVPAVATTSSNISGKPSTAPNLVSTTPVTPMGLVNVSSSNLSVNVPNQTAQISPTFSSNAYDLQTPNRPPTAPAAIMHLVNEKIVGSEHLSIWRGRLSLKNEEVHTQMFHLSGNIELFKVCMAVLGDSNSQLLKIAQRMRFEPSQLEGVNRKLRQQSDFTMCLGLAAPATTTGLGDFDQQHTLMNRIMKESFIKYLQEKSAAGIINVYHPATQENLYVIHIFPPCEFSQIQLQSAAPDVHSRLTENRVPHLLIVITTV